MQILKKVFFNFQEQILKLINSERVNEFHHFRRSIFKMKGRDLTLNSLCWERGEEEERGWGKEEE